MSELRLVLIGVGLLLLAAVLAWEMHRRRAGKGPSAPALARRAAQWLRGCLARSRAAGTRPAQRRPLAGPELGTLEADAAHGTAGDGELEVGDLGALASAVRTVPGRGPRNGGAGPAKLSTPALEEGGDDERLLMVITLMAPAGAPFGGARLCAALDGLDLEHGRMGLFHHYGGRAGEHAMPVFSVANVVEPGTFELEEMAHFATPGLCLFMQLPGPLDGVPAFELMLNVAAKLARELGGELRDGRRSALTGQGVQRMREQVIEHTALHGRRVAPARPDRVLH